MSGTSTEIQEAPLVTRSYSESAERIYGIYYLEPVKNPEDKTSGWAVINARRDGKSYVFLNGKSGTSWLEARNIQGSAPVVVIQRGILGALSGKHIISVAIDNLLVPYAKLKLISTISSHLKSHYEVKLIVPKPGQPNYNPETVESIFHWEIKTPTRWGLTKINDKNSKLIATCDFPNSNFKSTVAKPISTVDILDYPYPSNLSTNSSLSEGSANHDRVVTFYRKLPMPLILALLSTISYIQF